MNGETLLGKAGVDPERYILRVVIDEWERRVFERKKYYPGIRKKWVAGQAILLARRKERGDSFIGYGVVGRIQTQNELSESERKQCRTYG